MRPGPDRHGVPDSPLAFFEQVAALAGTDASAAFLRVAQDAAWIPEGIDGTVHADPRCGGTVRPAGPTGGRAVVEGRWDGVVVGAEWFCLVAAPQDRASRRAGPDRVARCLVLLGHDQVRVLPGSAVPGLGGLTLRTVVVDGAEVDRSRVGPSPATHVPVSGATGGLPVACASAVGRAAVALGAARAAAQGLLDRGLHRPRSGVAIPDRVRRRAEQELVAATSAHLAARALLRSELADLGSRGGPVTAGDRTVLAVHALHAHEPARRLTDVVFRAGGGSALGRDDVAARSWRDVETVAALAGGAEVVEGVTDAALGRFVPDDVR